MDRERELLVLPRFKVLGFLAQVEESDYASIADFTGLSVPDISRAVGFLDDRALVDVRKDRNGRYARTQVRATDDGVREFRALLATLRRYGL
ncbi:hypothetical protein GCM10025875_01010 [Litorihabitans aurantiacus]|uniref:Winged helix DNA-binding domain-containing protein n=1 Tax=Litorihabitans aurantiacus TaxID=1930061 RepID=A0AA37UL04_9MICO|nr:hypothetical protein GCM10025875_01010 [Litorihabitans aurantiacus]